VRVKFALPVAPGGDTLVGVEEEEQRGEALGAQSLSEVLGGIPVATVVRDEQRGQLFLPPLLRPEGSCPFHGAARRRRAWYKRGVRLFKPLLESFCEAEANVRELHFCERR
jgi:hypothetical protein